MDDFDADEIFRDLEDIEPDEEEKDERQELILGQNGRIFNHEDLFMGDDEY